MNALKFGLLGAIGGFAKGQADDIKSQEDEKFKMDYLQKQLDSKREISNAVTNAKVDMFDKMNEERQRWHDQLDAMNQKRETDKSAYYDAKTQNASDMLDAKRQALDASSAASGARADAATARLGLAQNDSAARADARTQAEQDTQDKANQKILDNANTQAEKSITAFGKAGSDQKASLYAKYNVSAADPNADMYVADAIRQEKFQNLPDKAKAYAKSNNVDLNPLNSTLGDVPVAKPERPSVLGLTYGTAPDQKIPRVSSGAAQGSTPPVQAAPAPPAPTTAIPPAAIARLKQNASNPQALSDFQAAFGVDPSQYLGQ